MFTLPMYFLKAMEAKEKAKTTSLTEVGTLRSFTMAQEATGRAHITIGVF